MENNPKKSKAFIIAFILILLLLLAGYYLFVNRATIFDTKGVVTMQKIFAPLLGSSKNKDLSVIGGTDTNPNATNAPITSVVVTDQNGNRIVRAEAGENIKKGDVLYVSSLNKNNDPIVMKAIANDKSKSIVFGVAGEDMNKGTMGNIIIEGILTGVPTNRIEITAWAPNNPLYLSDKIYGGMTKNPPYAPSFIVQVGSVISVDAINGSIRIGGILNGTNIPVVDNNGFILNPINIPGTSGSSDNLPTVTAVASPSSIIAGGSSVISWISTKATVCNAGTGNGTGTTGSFKTGSLSKSMSYSVTCTGANGSKYTGNTSVFIMDASGGTGGIFPFVKVTAKPTSINSGEFSTISWVATKSVSCDAGTGNGTGTTGSFKTGVLTTDTSYSIVCTDAKGSKGSGNVYVTVSPPTPPNVTECADGIDNDKDGLIDAADPNCHQGNDLNKPYNAKSYSESSYTYVTECADGIDNDKDGLIDAADSNCHQGNDLNKPYNAKSYSESSYTNNWPTIEVKATPNKPIAVGETSIITWTSTNTTSCDAGIGTSTGTSGQFITEALSKSRSYTVTCKGDNGEVSGDVYVNVLDSYKFPIVTTTATPPSINSGESSTIRWTSTNATSCNAGAGRGTGTTGSFDTGSLTKTTSYTVTCIGPNGQRGGNTSVSVTGGGNTNGKPQCSDGIDNNSNRLIDINEPNCHLGGDLNKEYMPLHDSEDTPPTECSDGIDNNGNGLIDKDDPNCHVGGNLNKEYTPTHISESTPPTQCDDGSDNDADGKVDAEDSGCHTDGDMANEYIPTWDSEKTPPTSPYENTCKVIDSNPLEFNDVEKAQLDELLRKFYLIAPNLRTEDDINIAYSEITQYQNFSDHLKTLINQCKIQTSDPAYITAGGPTTKFGNPWYQYSTKRGSYIDKNFDCKYVSGWFSGNGADGKNCDTYNTKIYALNPASCSGSLNLYNLSSSSSWSTHSELYYANIAARQGNVRAQQDIIYTDGLKNKCIWNPGAKVADLEKIFNVW